MYRRHCAIGYFPLSIARCVSACVHACTSPLGARRNVFNVLTGASRYRNDRDLAFYVLTYDGAKKCEDVRGANQVTRSENDRPAARVPRKRNAEETTGLIVRERRRASLSPGYPLSAPSSRLQDRIAVHTGDALIISRSEMITSTKHRD